MALHSLKTFKPILFPKTYPHLLFPKRFNSPTPLTLVLNLFNLSHINKINISINEHLNLKLVSSIFIFFQNKTFKKLWKIVFISYNKLFSFLNCLMFCQFFFFSFRFLESKGHNKKGIFENMFCNSKSLITSSRIFFHSLAQKRGARWKGKNQITFFMVFFKITYFQRCLACIGCFGLFTKSSILPSQWQGL